MRYNFKPDEMLHPREFLVALHVFYQVGAFQGLRLSLASSRIVI